MKFKVNIDCDYVVGHLRYGHFEGEVEVETEDELKELIEDGSITDYLELIIDDFEVDDYEIDCDTAKYESIK